MRALRLLTLVLSIALSVLMAACKCHPSAYADPRPAVDASVLKGTWMVETVNGAAVAGVGDTWVINDTHIAIASSSKDCHTAMTYTSEYNDIHGAYTENSCGVEPVGARYTMTWSVGGERLSVKMNSGGPAIVLHKVRTGIAGNGEGSNG